MSEEVYPGSNLKLLPQLDWYCPLVYLFWDWLHVVCHLLKSPSFESSGKRSFAHCSSFSMLPSHERGIAQGIDFVDDVASGTGVR